MIEEEPMPDNTKFKGIKRVERPTEDDLARDALGGPRGSDTLPPAPMTRQEGEQTSPNDEPGHVA
jgi:hypothetical protein